MNSSFQIIGWILIVMGVLEFFLIDIILPLLMRQNTGSDEQKAKSARMIRLAFKTAAVISVLLGLAILKGFFNKS